MKENELTFTYITDPELVDHLRKVGIKPIHTGLNVSTQEQFWQYIDTNELSSVLTAWKDKKNQEKYSMDRWGKSK